MVPDFDADVRRVLAEFDARELTRNENPCFLFVSALR